MGTTTFAKYAIGGFFPWAHCKLIVGTLPATHGVRGVIVYFEQTKKGRNTCALLGLITSAMTAIIDRTILPQRVSKITGRSITTFVVPVGISSKTKTTSGWLVTSAHLMLIMREVAQVHS